MEYTGYIYKVSNNVNDNVYIGLTTETICERWSKHWNDVNSKKQRGLYLNHFQRALLKYGKDSFEIHSIITIIKPTKSELLDELKKLEKIWITKYNSFTNGYNSTLGGDGTLGLSGKLNHGYGKHLSDETKRKISISNTGKDSYWKGKNLPIEIRDKISKARKGKYSGKNHPLYGISVSQQHKDMLSDNNSMVVLQYDFFGNFVNKYKSATKASEDYKVGVSSISNACRRNVFASNGFIWFYEYEFSEKILKDKLNQMAYHNSYKKYYYANEVWELFNQGKKIIEIQNIIHITGDLIRTCLLLGNSIGKCTYDSSSSQLLSVSKQIKIIGFNNTYYFKSLREAVLKSKDIIGVEMSTRGLSYAFNNNKIYKGFAINIA